MAEHDEAMSVLGLLYPDDVSILVNLSQGGVEAEYDRVCKSLILYRGPHVLADLTKEETYNLLALLHAEMPAEGGVS